MGDKLVQSWVDFACTGKLNSKSITAVVCDGKFAGDPTPPGSSLGPWSPVSAERHEYLRLDSESRMEMSQNFVDRVNIWREVMAERPLP